MDKEQIVAELRRVAEKTNASHISIRQFARHSKISVSTITGTFGTWNQALEAAGLQAIPPGPSPDSHLKRYSDEVLLQEIVRLTGELGKKPSQDEMRAKGHFSPGPYYQRWGSFAKAREIAYATYGFPDVNPEQRVNLLRGEQTPSKPSMGNVRVPETYKPADVQRRRKVQFGEPIDFRGLRFAPINEQGVVYLFGMISREIGFLIESIRTDYPDCEGKRCIDAQRQRWEHVRIEFEYQSSNFREHGHNPEDCDIVVCWIHDWQDCPLEVLELKSAISYLPRQPAS